jgi:hypothetical protein
MPFGRSCLSRRCQLANRPIAAKLRVSFKTLPAWNHLVAFVCVLAAVAFAFWPKSWQ